MFTGIIENMNEVICLRNEESNLHITFKSAITHELSVDQSVAHNGVCLTIIDINNDNYTVTAIKETLDKTNLGLLKVGDKVNIERSLQINSRLDGHIVQGHIDQISKCLNIEEKEGSFIFMFDYSKENKNLIVKKGSICINGVSLTVMDVEDTFFSVAVIPYTYENTNFCLFNKGEMANIEFDVFGKYVNKILEDRV
ncbi:MAG: riboflavin synthase [Bacteroidota bacterium]|nr:riboflavin synthase [Bacteroidota bacterium]